MKKIISICLLIAMLLSVTICVHASSGKVWFLSDSSFQVGGTATADLYGTAMSIIQDSNVTSDLYNAALNFNMKFSWICSNGADKYGQSVTWTAADEGKEFVCRVGFYSDSACTDLVDYIDSEPFTIQGKQSLTIHTKELHNAVKGEEYYVQISSSDANAVFSEFMGSELSSFGLTLHSNGIIDGIPTKTGNCHINILVTGPSGENSTSYDLTVLDSTESYLEILDYPTQTTYMVGETFNPSGMRVKITTFDGSTMISKDGQYLEYTKEPLKNQGDVKIKLKHGDAFTFVYITVVPASGAGGAGDMPPAITLKELPTAYVGEEYYVRIDCGDLNAEFWEYYNPGRANDLSKTGLTLAKNGVLAGTPTKAGSYTFTICAGNDNGEDYATYTLVVKEASEKDPDETIAEPTEPGETVDPTVPAETPEQKPENPATNPTDATEPSGNTSTTGTAVEPQKSNSLVSFFVGLGGVGIVLAIGLLLLAVAVLALIIIIIIIVIVKKKKKKKNTKA